MDGLMDGTLARIEPRKEKLTRGRWDKGEGIIYEYVPLLAGRAYRVRICN